MIESIDYFADDDFNIDFPELSVSEAAIPVSASPTPRFLFDVGGNGRIVGGTLTGTIFINSKRIGALPGRGFSINFATDITSGALFFGGRNYGEIDSLRVTGRFSSAGEIELTFSNRYQIDVGLAVTRPGEQLVYPGPVEIQNVAFLQHVTPAQPNDFTLFAGHDLPSQLHVDLNAAGSTINIDSPVIVAAATGPSNVRDIDLRATNVNLNSMVSSQDDLYIGHSAITGTPAELVRLNAAVAAPGAVEIHVDNDPLNDGSGGPVKGELIISQSGRISGQLQPLSIPFGDPTITPIFAEEEPNNDRGQAGQNGNLMGSFTRIADETYRASVIGDVRGGADRDWFRIETRPNDLIVFDMEGLATGAGSHRDPYLYLYGPTVDTPLDIDDDSGIGLNARITHVVPAAGPTTLFIVADSFGNTAGSYKLTVTVFREPARPTATLLVDALAADVFVEGTVYATNQSWLMQSTAASNTHAPYSLTTKSKATGGRTGLIRGDTVAITLGNDAETPLNNAISYNTLDIDTDITSLRTKASTRAGGDSSALNPFPYRLTVRENNSLLIDAVAASSLPMSFAADGDMGFTSSVNTAGGIHISTRRVGNTYGAFQAASAMTSTRGSIDITARNIIVGNTMAVTDAPLDPGATDISLNAVDGGIDISGLVSARNDISLRQQTPDSKTGRIQGNGRIRARNLRVFADSVGNALVRQSDPLFFLQTEIETVTGEVGNGFAIREVDDVSVSQLRVPAGLVALVADGVDERAGSPNNIALRATAIDVRNMVVSTPNGSLNVRIDSGNDLVLGDALAIREGTSINMVAAGDAVIRSSAGPIRVLDAPVGGTGARSALYQTIQILQGTYDPGVPGVFAGEIAVNDADLRSALGGAVGSLLQSGIRVLVKDGVTRVKDGVTGQPVSADRPLAANGVYVATQTSPGSNWMLRRAPDADTFAELPSGTVVYVSSTNEYRRLTHAIADATTFGRVNILVSGPTPRKTEIGSDLPLPNAVVDFVVSSTSGATNAPGSLGKMISLRQNNDTLSSANPQQPMGFSFSSIIGGRIELTEELPAIRLPVVGDPLHIDGDRRFTPPVPPGTNFGPTTKISVIGTLISKTSSGEPRVTRAVNARPVSATEAERLGIDAARARRTLVVSSTALAAVIPNMAASTVGIHPGSRTNEVKVGVTTLSPDGTLGTVELTERLANDWIAGARTVTFATEIDGFTFTADAKGAAVANLAVGGFESGAGIRIVTPETDGPSAFPGVTVQNMRLGQDWAGVRAGNEFGVLIANKGSALIAGGLFTSSSGAAIRTQDDASNIVIEGVQVGSATDFNVVGIELAGTGAVTLGRAGENTNRTVISNNRLGVLLRAGTNRISNTTISGNSFEGVKIEGGNYQIGDTSTRTATSNVIIGNGGWGLNVAPSVSPNNPQTTVPLRLVQGNYLGVTIDGAAAPNKLGNVALAGTVADSRLGFRPRASGIDTHGNLHGPRPAEPTLYVAAPLDNSGADIVPDDNRIHVRGGSAMLNEMALMLEDDADAINESSVVAEAFSIQYSPSLSVRDTEWSGPGIQTLVAGTNFTFRYEASARRVVLSSLTGFQNGSYRILVNNSATTGVRDASGNAVLANDITSPGVTGFVVILDANATGPEPPIGPPEPPTDGDTFEIGPTADGSTLFVDATRRETQNILIRNTGDIVIRGLVEAPQAGRRISVTSTNGRVRFEPGGEFRAGAVSLAAQGDSQLRISPAAIIQSAIVASGALEVTSNGLVQQSGPISATTLAVNSLAGSVNLANAGNAVAVFSASANGRGGSVTFVNSRGFTVGGSGVSAGTADVLDGQVSLTAQSGNITVAAPISSRQDVAFVRAPAGTVSVNSGIANSASPLIRQDTNGTVVEGGFTVGDAAGLATALQVINTLPNGPVYEVVVAASFVIDRTMAFVNAVDLRGSTAGIALSGSSTVANGVTLGAFSNGSRITNLAFSNFTGTAISLDGARDVVLRGLRVTDSGTGLSLAGDVSGTTVQGVTFRLTDVALRFSDARSATVGGNDVADRVRIEGARRAGVFASGLNTGTKLIRPTFTTNPATRVRFNIRSGRNLRVIGTIVERAVSTRPPSGTVRPPFSLFGR